MSLFWRCDDIQTRIYLPRGWGTDVSTHGSGDACVVLKALPSEEVLARSFHLQLGPLSPHVLNHAMDSALATDQYLPGDTGLL